MVKTTVPSNIELASTARSTDNGAGHDVRPAFTSAAIGMSWQLALVVLIPILGGYKLDANLKTSPWWTLVGLIVGLVMSIVVVRRALASFGNFNVPSSPTDAPKAVSINDKASKKSYNQHEDESK